MATTQLSTFGLALGFMWNAPNAGFSSVALNTANTWVAFGVKLADTKTLSKVRVYCSAVSGTLTGLSCSVYSDVPGSPNASLSSTTTVTLLPTGAAWVEFTGLSQSLTAGTQYWIVIKNTTGTPASNNLTLQFFGSTCGSWFQSLLKATMGPAKLHTTDGATWGTGVSGGSNARLEMSDGSLCGLPLQQPAVNSTQMVYSTRQYGIYFVSPSNMRFKARGVAAFFGAAVGTPTQNCHFNLYTGASPSLQATTPDLPAALVKATGLYQGWFSSPVTVEPGTTCRVTCEETSQADTSSNAYKFYESPIEAVSQGCLPYGGMQRTYYDGSSWTDTNTAIPGFILIGDTDGEFNPMNNASRQFLGM